MRSCGGINLTRLCQEQLSESCSVLTSLKRQLNKQPISIKKSKKIITLINLYCIKVHDQIKVFYALILWNLQSRNKFTLSSLLCSCVNKSEIKRSIGITLHSRSNILPLKPYNVVA